MKFLCEQCKAKYQIADEKAAGKTVRMKCRKCGHLIEVRAAVTETSVSSALPQHERTSGPPVGSSPPQRPPPPRAKPPTAARATAEAAAKPQRPAGALEGAFKSAIQHEGEEISAPFDMSDMSPSDEWYVAINGVPVGPIRVAEVRRKAALGAVSEDSLVWQEGLDEWRPLRSFPELATSVREAMRRLSRPPPTEVRSSGPPPPPSRAPGRSVPSGGSAARTSPPRAPPSSWPRSNVVPFMSRLATAEKLDDPVQERTSPVPGQPFATPQPVRASVVPDPFASASAHQAPALASAVAAPFSTAPPPAKKAPPWMALAMIAAAVAFGVTTAVVLFIHPAPPPPPVAVTAPGTPATAAATSTAVSAPAAGDFTEPATNQVVTVVKGSTGNGGTKAAPSATPASAGRSLDLHSLAQNAPNVTPVDEQGSEGPKAPGQCISEGQVQQVIGLHQTGIRRACWERNPTVKPTVNVGVTMTIGPEGSAQNVVATGDEPSVSKCIENDLRSWRFPAMGCAQKTSFSFKFVRQ